MKKRTSKNYGKSQMLKQEGKDFKSAGSSIQKSKGQGTLPSRASLQVTKKSVAKDKYRKDPAYRYSSGGRSIAKAVQREDRRTSRRKK